MVSKFLELLWYRDIANAKVGIVIVMMTKKSRATSFGTRTL